MPYSPGNIIRNPVVGFEVPPLPRDPDSGTNYVHMQVQAIRADGSWTSPLLDYESISNQSPWNYSDGNAWQPWPSGGVESYKVWEIHTTGKGYDWSWYGYSGYNGRIVLPTYLLRDTEYRYRLRPYNVEAGQYVSWVDGGKYGTLRL